MKKKIVLVFCGAMLLFLLTCWTAAYSIYAAGWAESLCFFVFTLLVLNRYAESDTYGIPFVLAVLAGRIVLELPLRIIEFRETMFSLFVPCIVIISILLASVYFKEKRTAVLILAVIILVLLNTVAHDAWYHCCLHDR